MKTHFFQTVKCLDIFKVIEEMDYRVSCLFTHLLYPEYLFVFYFVEVFDLFEVPCEQLCGIFTYMDNAEGENETRKGRCLALLDRVHQVLRRLFCEPREFEQGLFFKAVNIRKVVYQIVRIQELYIFLSEPLNVHSTS